MKKIKCKIHRMCTLDDLPPHLLKFRFAPDGTIVCCQFGNVIDIKTEQGIYRVLLLQVPSTDKYDGVEVSQKDIINDWKYSTRYENN